MPKRKKTGGRDFQPGQSGNPAGRKPTPPHLKAVKKLTAHHMALVISKLLSMTATELHEYLSRPFTPMIEKTIGSILVAATKESDHAKLNFLLDRSIGKVKEVTEVQLPEPTLIRRRSGEILELGASVKEPIEAEYEEN